MVGGIVIETIRSEGKVWINCKEHKSKSTCAVFVEDEPAARCVEDGDSIWWQAGIVFWTPKSKAIVEKQLKKIGCSGAHRPELAYEK